MLNHNKNRNRPRGGGLKVMLGNNKPEADHLLLEVAIKVPLSQFRVVSNG
jgi:hypothetical protein